MDLSILLLLPRRLTPRTTQRATKGLRHLYLQIKQQKTRTSKQCLKFVSLILLNRRIYSLGTGGTTDVGLILLETGGDQ